MIKTLSKAQKMEREKFRIPRSVQDAIPIRRIFADGIFQVGNQYSKTWSFTDINYAIASKEDKTSMFLDYSELLNALDSGASAKITIYNRRINKAEFERSVLLPDKDDGLDEYRHEFNQMLTAQVTGTSNSIVRERYLTVSVVKRNADEARSYFARVGTDLVTHLAQLSSVATELTLNERLHIFRDFFKAGEQAAAEFNIHEHAKRGQHFKDWFCPDSMEFSADHFKLDARYGRVLYLQDYASYIKDSMINELTGKVCRQLGIDTILRGLRNTVDFEYERNIMQVNQTLFPEIKTVLLFTPARYVAISSSVIRELVTFGGDPTPLMPENIDIKNYL